MSNWKFGEIFVFGIIIFLVLSVAINYLANVPRPADEAAKIEAEDQAVVSLARELYFAKKEAGMDMTAGPCLANDFMPDWVLDTVHNPRTEADNLLENQCEDFYSGKAKHFLELDEAGNFVRMK